MKDKKNKTKRKKAVEMLKKERDYLEKLHNSIGEAIFTVKIPERVIISVNKAIEDIFGYKASECIGLKTEIFYPNKKGFLDFGRKLKMAIEQGKDIIHAEQLLKRENGEVFPTEITTSFLREDGKISHVISIVRDITERKQAEDHIQHLQSVLKAIRNINQLIVHEKNQKKLLQGACEILNQSRNYRLVWIGLIQEGIKDVLPVAQAGFEKGYLKSIKITWDDSETGKGPTGTAIRTQKPFVMHDIAVDPRYKLWREEAMKRGYASSVAVPLVYENKVFGALNVYATISNAFDEEEINLLLEVGQDIVFALKTIEIEGEIKRTKEFLQNIIDNTSDMVCTIDLKGNFLSINRAVTEQMGYEKEDLIGRPKMKFAVNPELFENAFRKVLEKGSLSNVEVPFKRKDGTIADILYSVTLLRDKDGHPIAVAGLGKDITERKKMAQELKISEEKLKEQKEELERKNTALREMLVQLESEKRNIKENVESNIDKLLWPIINRFKRGQVSSKSLDLLERNIEKIASSFGSKVSEKRYHLTPKELEICNMIRSGFSSKDMSGELNLSLKTIEQHRKNIRKKLNITSKKLNLTSYLQNI